MCNQYSIIVRNKLDPLQGTSKIHNPNDDNLEIFAYTAAQNESLLHRIEQGARGIGFYVDSDKT